MKTLIFSLQVGHVKNNVLSSREMHTKSLNFFFQVGHAKIIYLYLGLIMEKLTKHYTRNMYLLLLQKPC